MQHHSGILCLVLLAMVMAADATRNPIKGILSVRGTKGRPLRSIITPNTVDYVDGTTAVYGERKRAVDHEYLQGVSAIISNDRHKDAANEGQTSAAALYSLYAVAATAASSPENAYLILRIHLPYILAPEHLTSVCAAAVDPLNVVRRSSDMSASILDIICDVGKPPRPTSSASRGAHAATRTLSYKSKIIPGVSRNILKAWNRALAIHVSDETVTDPKRRWVESVDFLRRAASPQSKEITSETVHAHLILSQQYFPDAKPPSNPASPDTSMWSTTAAYVSSYFRESVSQTKWTALKHYVAWLTLDPKRARLYTIHLCALLSEPGATPSTDPAKAPFYCLCRLPHIADDPLRILKTLQKHFTPASHHSKKEKDYLKARIALSKPTASASTKFVVPNPAHYEDDFLLKAVLHTNSAPFKKKLSSTDPAFLTYDEELMRMANSNSDASMDLIERYKKAERDYTTIARKYEHKALEHIRAKNKLRVLRAKKDDASLKEPLPKRSPHRLAEIFPDEDVSPTPIPKSTHPHSLKNHGKSVSFSFPSKTTPPTPVRRGVSFGALPIGRDLPRPILQRAVFSHEQTPRGALPQDHLTTVTLPAFSQTPSSLFPPIPEALRRKKEPTPVRMRSFGQAMDEL